VKVQVIRSRFVPGRVLIGPKVVGEGYYRIVSQLDRSGRIEAFDPHSRSWSAAPDGVTFSEVWSAPPATQWTMDLAGAAPSAGEDEDVAGPEGYAAAQGDPQQPDVASVEQ
jgi:hypothetical protein